MNIVTDLTENGPVEIRGALDLEKTGAGLLPRRLPAWTKPQIPDPFCEMVIAQPAGVRLAFETGATEIALQVLTTKYQFLEANRTLWDGSFELVVDNEPGEHITSPDGNLLTIDISGYRKLTSGDPATVRFSPLRAGIKQIEIWLPQSTQVELIELRTNDAVFPPASPPPVKWIHYGSSISQCAEAGSPLGAWPVVAARLAGVDVINLALGGNALLDPFVARTIRDSPADLISLKIGMNIVNLDALRRRTFFPAVHGFLDTIRDGHPSTPLVVISPTHCPIVEELPGPTTADFTDTGVSFRSTGDPASIANGALTLYEIRSTLDAIVKQREEVDSNLYYLDGQKLFGAADAGDLPDGLHPNAMGYRRMGERFAALMFGPGQAFSAALR
jgi:GDSL-like Lipase/Acylhydrolase family